MTSTQPSVLRRYMRGERSGRGSVCHPDTSNLVVVDPPRDREPIEDDQLLLEALAEPEATGPSEARLRQRIEQRILETRAAMESRRTDSRTIDTVLYASERNARIPASLLAGALASRIVVYVIPFLALWVLGTGLYSDIASANAVDAAREAGLAGLFADAVEDTVGASQGFRAISLIAVIFATLWAADSLAKLMRRVYALLWSAPMSRPRRRWTLPLSVIAISIGAMAISRLGLEVGDWPPSVVVGEIVVEFAAVTIGWLLVAGVLPHEPAAHRWTHKLPGALLIAVGVIGMKTAMILYFAPRLVTLTSRYGEVASALLLITWAYFLAFIVVFSAELNVALFRSWQRRRGEPQIS